MSKLSPMVPSFLSCSWTSSDTAIVVVCIPHLGTDLRNDYITFVPHVGIRYHMTATKRSLADLILSVLQVLPGENPSVTYDALYEVICPLRGGNPSRRDFQKSLDTLRTDGLVTMEEDPKDRRRKLIRLARAKDPKDPGLYEQILDTRLRDFLVELFKKEPWLMPAKIPLVIKDQPSTWHHPDPKTLVESYPLWQGLTEGQAKEVISLERTTWDKIRRTVGNRRDLLERKAQNFITVMADINTEEILEAWKQRRAIDRSKIIDTMRRRLTSIQ